MAQYCMVIDLQKCAGCGACGIACKTENNTPDRKNGQTFNWADYMIKMEGRFPNVSFAAVPVLCNHCSNAACVEACPVEPKAMFKTPEGITMHNDERCIGCRSCQIACPYSAEDVEAEKAEYSVISFNFDGDDVHSAYTSKAAVIPGATASGAETAKKTGGLPPYKTNYSHPEYEAVRRAGVTEKCYLCHHRLMTDKKPWCVESCPSGARVVGDKDDPNSEVSKLLAKYPSMVLKPEEGTKPNVYYIRKFKV